MSALLWHDPLLLIALVALPLFALLALLERRRRAALRFPLAALLSSAPRAMARFWWLPHLLRAGAFALIVIAAARPQSHGTEVRDLSVEGIDIVIALDISTSMNAADFQPSDRITVAKSVLERFIAGRTNDRLGLVIFAGEAYTQSPLTLDYQVLDSILESVQTGLIPDGTAIGSAIATSINRLRDSEAKSKVIILITDGDNNAGSLPPMKAAELAKEFGIRVYTILVGKGGRVPFPAGTNFLGQQLWREAEIPVNPELLAAIAKETGAEAYNAVDKQSLEQGLSDVLDHLEKTKLHPSPGFKDLLEHFPPLLIGALLLLFAELLLSLTRLRSFP